MTIKPMDADSLLSDAISSIPGFGVLQQLLKQSFGVEANELVSKYLIVFAIYKFAIWLYEHAYDFLENHFTSAIEVDDYDPLWQQLSDWARTQPMTKISREIKAVTLFASAYRDPDDEDALLTDKVEEEDDDDDVSGPTGLFSFDAWNRKNPLIYKPNVKMTFFKHKGRYFQWKNSLRDTLYGNGKNQLITIRCLSRNTKPIKQFLEHIKGWTHEKQVVKPTEVFRTSSRSQGGDGGGGWSRVAVRPSRPLSTVALDDAQKGMILRDINEYLQPATARWYSARGIPYRRGYLFHGPPGTGKTSLSFSLAGIFGLRIYCVALGETGLTEATLGSLFAQLPERCIVLLEDIDSAGLKHEGGENEEDNKSNNQLNNDSIDQDDDSDSDSDDDQGVESKPKVKPKNNTSLNGGAIKPGFISLAGLLNVIDGAASQEGRVLIMTTNHPEKLDAALIRPGRVDLRIRFTLATRPQIREIFMRMYNTALDKKKDKKGKNVVGDGEDTGGGLFESAEEKAFLERHLRKRTPPTIQPKELAKLAETFASSLPSEVFSPAEVQGFLVKRKTDPVGAVSEVEKWKVEQIDAKKKGKEDVDAAEGTLDAEVNDGQDEGGEVGVKGNKHQMDDRLEKEEGRELETNMMMFGAFGQ